MRSTGTDHQLTLATWRKCWQKCSKMVVSSLLNSVIFLKALCFDSYQENPRKPDLDALRATYHQNPVPYPTDLVVAGSATLFSFTFKGMNEGTSDLLLSQLRKVDSLIPISQDQESWVGLQACAIVYLTEICATEQRSIVLAWPTALFSAGVLLVSIINTCVSWPIACLGFSLAAFALAIAELFVPESPSWLFRQGKEGAAVKNLQRLGRSQAGLHLEIETLRQRKSSTESLSWRTFLRPTVWKPFVILVIFHVLQFSTGFWNIIYYQEDFVVRLGTRYDPALVSVALSIVGFLINVTVGVYTRSISRKLSTAMSGFCMAVPLVGAVVYEYHYRNTPLIDRPVQWLPLLFIFAYQGAAYLAAVNLPWTMIGELYPLSVRGIMTGATYFVAYCTNFAYVKSYFACLGVLKIYGVLFLFAASSFLNGLFGIYILPETHGKSLVEVEQGFEGKTPEIDQNIVVPLVSMN